MKSRREASKCREWEKVRRDKLNKGFATLCKLLPNHDPSLTLSKIDILQKATEYIEELQGKLKDVLTADGVKKTEREEIKALYERIRKLLIRNEQLCNLLKDASIKIPTEYGSIKNFKEPLRWRNKITPEQAKQFVKEETQKENKKETNKLPKKLKLKNCLKKTLSPAVKHRKNQKKANKKITIAKKSAVIRVQLSNLMSIPRQNLPVASTQSCFIITNNPPLGLPTVNCRTSKAAPTVVTNSSSLAAPKMASIIKPPTSTVIPKVNAALSSLGPGTLILANGNIVPILPQSTAILPAPTILTNPAPLILKPPSSNTTLIVMPTKNGKEIATSTSGSKVSTVTAVTSTKTFANIKPKIGITRTTQVNKVPIPALTSRYSDLSSSGSKPTANDKSAKKHEGESANTKKVPKGSKTKRKVTSANNLGNKRLKVDATVTLASESSATKPEATDANQKVNKSDVRLENVIKVAHKEQEVCVTRGSESAAVNCSSEPRVPLETVASSSTAAVKELEIIKDVDTKKQNDNVSPADKKTGDDNVSKENSANVDKESDKIKTDVSKSDAAVKASVTEVVNVPKNSLESDKQNATLDKQSVQERTTKSNKGVTDIKPDKNKVPVTTTTDYQLLNNQEKAPVSVANEDKPDTVIKTNPSIIPGDANTEIQDKNLELGMNLNHSELSNDIFSSLQVPIGGQNPESTSPTAAFLLAFPLVSSLTGVKVTEVIEEENSDSRHGTPTLLQIGTMDTTKTTQSIHSESLTPNLLNLDNFSFFSGKDMCNNFYSSFDNSACTTNNAYPITSVQVLDSAKNSSCKESDGLNSSKQSKVACAPQVQPKLQPKETTSESHVPSNVQKTSNSSVLYTTEGPVIAKSNVVTQNNFVRQNTSVSYSKLASVTSSYVHGSTQAHYDGRHKNSSTASVSACKDVVSYSTSNRKNPDPILSTSQYNTTTSSAASVAQCNAFNPFSDFSKPNTVHSYATFSKPYSDPLYTNSTHYNYSHHNENNFEQAMYYSAKPAPSKTSGTTYGTPNYTETPYNVDCKSKRESNQRHNPVNYYNQAKTQIKEKFSTHSSKGTKATSNQPKPPINWMTTPDFRSQPANPEYLVPPFGKDIEYNPNSFYSSNSFVPTTHTSYFNTTSTMYAPDFQNSIADNRKTFDSSLPIISTNSQRNEYEENQFSWSPTKLPQFLETPHSFVSSTLPTLVGDLALGTTQPPFAEQKVDHLIKSKESSRRSKAHVNYDNQSNFLSVSQLVENKTDPSPTRTNRRNSGNRNVKTTSQKGNKHSHKPAETKELVDGAGPALVLEKNSALKQSQPPNVNYSMQGVAENSNWMPDCNKSRHGHKNPQSSYSAEALIGHQDQDSSVPKQRYRQQQTNYTTPNKALPIPTFLSDNIVPYFPPVEIPQDNNFIQSNSNYQSSALTHSFSTSVQNNGYPSGTYISTGATITSSYLQSTGLIPEFGTHDYTTTISDNVVPHSIVASDKIDSKHCNRNDIIKQPVNNTNRTEERSNGPQQINTDCSATSSNNFIKKSKHKHSSESNLPGLVDFGFLSMPSTINSPILPDDFHAHSNFLPPPTPSQLYPCKNPLYSKQSSDLNSGSLLSLPPVPVTRTGTQHFEGSATANAGSSLTSFNLSAIFPEINKGAVPLPGLYSESSRNKNYNFQRNYLGGSVQVSFSNKSTSSSSYVNSVATSYAPTN